MNGIIYREIKINSRVIKHLGQDLITTPDVAVTELIKNSIDARANSIRLHIFDSFNSMNSNKSNLLFELPEEIISFFPDERKDFSIFIIEDNGKGMNESQLSHGFLEIGTSIKADSTEAYLGEKGIGRLATQRLGKVLLVETASADDRQASLTLIDWDSFREGSKYNVPSLYVEKKANHYTRLWILKANEQDYLDIPAQKQLYFDSATVPPIERDLRSAINFLISPFSDNKRINIEMYYENMRLQLAFDKPVLQLAESIHSFHVEKDKSGFVGLEYGLELRPWFVERVHLALVKSEAFKRLKKNHSFYDSFLETNRDRIRNVLCRRLNQEELIELICNETNSLYERAIPDKEQREKYCRKYALNIIENILKVLPITGEIYSFKQNASIGDHIIIESANEKNGSSHSLKELKEFLADNNGIKLYREDYRIGYLGNKENDWIKLQQFRTKGQQWYRFDLGNTVGYVSLSDIGQKYIREISSRLDIIQNEESDAFKLVVNLIFNKLFYELNRSANNILKVLLEEKGLLGESIRKQVSNNLNSIKLASKNNQELCKELDGLLSSLEEKDQGSGLEGDLTGKLAVMMKKTSDYLQKERAIQGEAASLLTQAEEKLKTIEVEAYNNFKLMANGLITETITHELDSVCRAGRLSDVECHFDVLKEYFVGAKNIKMYNTQVIPIKRNYDIVTNKISDVGNLYNFLEKTFIRKGTYDEFEATCINDVVENIKGNLLELSKNNIDIVCTTEDLTWIVPKGVLIHVLYNLFTNAIYWIDKRRKYADADNKYRSEVSDAIYVKTESQDAIIVYDTGTGVSKYMEDILFQPLESGKPNHEGRGMGLYIVQQLLRSFSADIELLEKRNDYGNRYIFRIELNAEDQNNE